MTFFRIRDIREEIFITLARLLEEGIPHIEEFIHEQAQYKRTNREGVAEKVKIRPKVVRYGTTSDIEEPTIRVRFEGKEDKWLSVRSTEDTYRFSIDCLVKNIKAPETDELVSIFASATQAWLVGDIRRLQSPIFNAAGQQIHSWYDSYATSIEMGIEMQGALRVAKINWWCKCWNFYHVTQGATP